MCFRGCCRAAVAAAFSWLQCIAFNDRCILLDPNLAEAHANLANALQQMGNMDMAIVYYQSALRLKPYFTDAYNNMASALVQKGLIPEAMDCYMQVTGGNILCVLQRPLLFVVLHRIRCDVGVCGWLLPGDALLRTAYFCRRVLFRCRFRCGLTPVVLTPAPCLQQALRVNPTLVDVHNNLGDLWRAQVCVLHKPPVPHPIS